MDLAALCTLHYYHITDRGCGYYGKTNVRDEPSRRAPKCYYTTLALPCPHLLSLAFLLDHTPANNVHAFVMKIFARRVSVNFSKDADTFTFAARRIFGAKQRESRPD